MRIKVEPYLMKKGNRVAKAAIEFDRTDGVLAGFHMIGFTICDDNEKGLFVLFPASTIKVGDETRPFFFLRPDNEERIGQLESAILDVYEGMISVDQPTIVNNINKG
jgi:hypothetical protein